MDIAATLVNYLDETTEIPWFHNVPVNPPVSQPSEFGTLTRDGGQTEIVRDLPTVTLIVYAENRGRAAELAMQAKQMLMLMKYSAANVFEAEILGDYYDPLDGRHRHRITASLIVND